MTNLEISNALFTDQKKLIIKAKMLVPKIAKKFKKGKAFPAWDYEEYTHQESRNRYLIMFYAPTPERADTPEYHFITFMEEDRQQIVVHWGCWMYRKQGELDCIATPYVGYYSGHFFSRYRERIWKGVKLSRNELLCRYFSRNLITLPIELNKDINRNYKEYGDFAEYAFQVPDGMSFIRHWNEGDKATIGQEDSNFVSVVLYITFVNGGLMTNSQKKAIFKEGTKYIANQYRKLIEDAMKETLIRRLDAQFQKIQEYAKRISHS